MLRSVRSARLEAWAASELMISNGRYWIDRVIGEDERPAEIVRRHLMCPKCDGADFESDIP
jgi:hypothetical protein